MKHPSALLCALVATASFVPAAFAASNSSEATIDWNNASYTLYAGTGTIDFSTFSSYSSSYAYVYDGSVFQNFSGNPLAVGGLSGSGNVVSGKMTASTSANYAAYDGYQDYINAYSQTLGSISLDAGAIVTFAVPFTVSVTASNAGPNEWASATAYWSLSDNSGYSTSSQKYIYANQWQASNSYSGILYLTFQNNSGGTQNYSLSAEVYTSAGSSIAAVPEPETYAMLLAGLGMVGMIARRRRQTSL